VSLTWLTISSFSLTTYDQRETLEPPNKLQDEDMYLQLLYYQLGNSEERCRLPSSFEALRLCNSSVLDKTSHWTWPSATIYETICWSLNLKIC